MDYVLFTEGTRPFLCTPSQAETLHRLSALRRGGIGTVHNYVPSTGWKEKPTVNIQGIFRISVESLYKRRLAALKAVEFGDVASGIAANPKLQALPINEALELFETRKGMLVASLEKSLSGDREDGHRQGHDVCYVAVSEGIKVNLDCYKDDDGLMQPKLVAGLPVAESIMLGYLELNRQYVSKGERKVVNSGPAVLMSNEIEAVLNSRSVQYRTLSLKSDNFSHITIDKETITPGDVTEEVSVLLG